MANIELRKTRIESLALVHLTGIQLILSAPRVYVTDVVPHHITVERGMLNLYFLRICCHYLVPKLKLRR